MTRSAAVSRAALFTSLAAIAVTGCSVTVDPARVLAGALVPFSACDDVLGYLKAEALQRVGPYGLEGDAQLYGRAVGDTAGSPVVPGPAPVAAGAEGSAAESPAVEGYSGTNVQEAGVDEPDIVKTDGDHIFTVVDGVLRVIDVATGTEVGRLDLLPVADDGSRMIDPAMIAGSAELLLAGDRALVLVRQPMAVFDTPTASPGWSMSSGARLIEVDLSDAAAPRRVSTLDLDGDIVSARLVDGVARVAVRTQPALEFPYDESLGDDEQAMIARNRSIISDSRLEDWLPSGRWSAGGDEEESLLVPCDRLSYPDEFSGYSTVSVLSLDVDGDLRESNGTGVLGSGDTVYASTDRFYVVTNGWTTAITPAVGVAPPVPGIAVPDGAAPDVAVPDTAAPDVVAPDAAVATPVPMPPGGGLAGPERVDSQRTNLHAFDISTAGPARYLGSGEVLGHLIGQYALSEWEGNLRVASTTGAIWGSNLRSESRVTVLEEQDGQLVPIGMVDGLGKGEEIFAVRYAGPTAYVVTFRQTDPLYVVDLADPTEPTVRGELKVTGYSAYLHPVGDGRVVGVGQAARRDGTQTGAQVSLFDVSNPAIPTKVSDQVVRGGWSAAEYEPRAFLYWPGTSTVVVPMADGQRSGALVLSVADDTVTEVGWVTAGTAAAQTGEPAQRMLVIGDELYTLWSNGLQSNDLDSLATTSWIPFS